METTFYNGTLHMAEFNIRGRYRFGVTNAREERLFENFTGKVICKNSDECTLLNGVLHSFNDSPAFFMGMVMTKMWLTDGIRDRIHGPAYITPLETTFFLNGSNTTFNKWFNASPLSDEQKLNIVMKYG